MHSTQNWQNKTKLNRPLSLLRIKSRKLYSFFLINLKLIVKEPSIKFTRSNALPVISKYNTMLFIINSTTQILKYSPELPNPEIQIRELLSREFIHNNADILFHRKQVLNYVRMKQYESVMNQQHPAFLSLCSWALGLITVPGVSGFLAPPGLLWTLALI